MFEGSILVAGILPAKIGLFILNFLFLIRKRRTVLELVMTAQAVEVENVSPTPTRFIRSTDLCHPCS